jgi:hypothetical protein
MTGEQLFALATVVFMVAVVALGLASNYRNRFKSAVLERLLIGRKKTRNKPKAFKSKPHESNQPVTDSELKALTAEEESAAELARLQELIEERKQVAIDTDLAHHLWSLYKNHFRFTGPQSLDPYNQADELYGVKILRASTHNNLNKFEFELKGARYKFIDDEENRNWSDNLKHFSLFLYDDSDNCLIEIPMKVKVDKLWRKYSVSSEGPKAFLPGGWTNDFVNATLVHQSLRNKEIRAQKHQERLWEIEDLKNRFGISD